MKEKATHIYGGISIFLCIISLISQFIKNPDISTIVTLLSGWAIAIINYGIIIFILKTQSRNHDRIVFLESALKEKTDEAQKLLIINEALAKQHLKEIPISRQS